MRISPVSGYLRVWLLGLCVAVVLGFGAAPAFSAAVVGGLSSATDPLTIEPDPAALPYANRSSVPEDGWPVLRISPQPVSKDIEAVWINRVYNPAGCIAPVYVDLRVYEYETVDSGPLGPKSLVGASEYPVLVGARGAEARWNFEQPVALVKGRAYAFFAVNVGVPGGGLTPAQAEPCVGMRPRVDTYPKVDRPSGPACVQMPHGEYQADPQKRHFRVRMRVPIEPTGNPFDGTMEDIDVPNRICGQQLTVDEVSPGLWVYVQDMGPGTRLTVSTRLATAPQTQILGQLLAAIGAPRCFGNEAEGVKFENVKTAQKVDSTFIPSRDGIEPDITYFHGGASHRCIVTQWPGSEADGQDIAWATAYPSSLGIPTAAGTRDPHHPQILDVTLDPDRSNRPGDRDPRETAGASNPAAPDIPRCDTQDPINCANGNFYEEFTDLALPARGGDLTLSRTYNAQSAALNQSGMFGRGWSTPLETSLEQVGDSEDRVVKHGNGSVAPFRWRDGAFIAPDWVRATLSKTGGGGYRYELPDHTVFWFAGDGKLERAVDPNGNQEVLTWDGARVASYTGGGRTFVFTHNADGTIATAADGTGRSVGYTYDSERRLIKVRDIAGNDTSFTYDDRSRMLTMTDPRGAVVTNEYDDRDRVITQTDPLGKVARLEYKRISANRRTTRVTDRDGVVTLKTFSRGVLVEETRGVGSSEATTVRITHNRLGLVSRTIDGNGEETRYEYDDRGNQTRVIDAAGRVTETQYNALDLPTQVRTPAGRVTVNTYDTNGNLTKTARTGIAESSTSFLYDTYGQLTSATNDNNGRASRFFYDAVGDQTRVEAPGAYASAPRVTAHDYDTRGEVVKTTLPAGMVTGADPLLHQIKYTRENRGLVTKVTDPLGAVTETTYDANGNVTTSRDPDGRLTTFTYDLLNRQGTITRADGGIERFFYSGEGKLVRRANAANQSTTFGFDELGRPSSETDPLGRVTRTQYDAADQVVAVRGNDGAGPRMTYDATGRLTKEQLYTASGSADVLGVNYAYDDDGLVTRASTSAEAVDLEWDSLGRLVSRTRADGAVTRMNYGVGGDLESIAYPDGLTQGSTGLQRRSFGSVKYDYNAAGEIVSVRDFSDRAFYFAYDQNGDLTKTIYPVGGARTVTRDRVGRPLSVTTSNSTRSYTYSPGGVPTSWGVGTTAPKQLSVDGALRLTSFGTAANGFDLAENPTTIADPTGSATQAFNAGGQQTTRTTAGGARTYTFDANYGRRTGESGGGPGQSTYIYDGYGRLKTLGGPLRTGTGSFFQTFAYSPDGTRRSTFRNGVTSFESWEDSLGGQSKILTQGHDAYIYGPEGLVLERVDSAGAPNYLWQDAIGSVISVTSATGSLKATFAYDAWGRRTQGFGNQAGTLGFTGEVTEPETDLQYLRARYYDPKTAQFLTRDPKEAQTGQPYLYAAGNPTMFTDPSGESILDGLRDFLGGAANGASFGKAKARGSDSCSGAYFAGQQLGGILDPFRKIKAVKKAGKAADDLIDSAQAVRPTVSDASLGRALADDYRAAAVVGDGSALDAAKHTVRTGELIGGSTHLIKAVELRDRYRKILRRADLSPEDMAVARSRFDAYDEFVRSHNLDTMMRRLR